MEPSTFDRLTRLFGTERSRRGVLKAIAGGAIGAMAAAVSRGESEAAAKRSVGNSCNLNADCASGLCVQESRGRKICHCQSPDDCPASSHACTEVTCTAGACVAATVGGIGAPCVLPRFYSVDPNSTLVDPPGFPGTGCCPGLVCQGVSYPETEPGTGACGVNHAPTVVAINLPHPWMTDCIPVTLIGLDPDNDALLLQPNTQPVNGVLVEFAANTGTIYAEAAPGVRALLLDGEYICRDGGHVPEPNDGHGDPQNIPAVWGEHNNADAQCAEGTYTRHTMCYATFSPTFSGTDSFTYTATDVYGAVSAPAIVTIIVNEV